MTSAPPPMDPDTSEADSTQLQLARAQGDAYGRALKHMVDDVAQTGGSRTVGEYLVGYAVEDAEGMYEVRDGQLHWRNPRHGEDVHVEVAVCDAADGRFIPAVTVTVTLISPGGQSSGPHELPLLWHPMIYHYGKDLTLPEDGRYTLQVHVAPPGFMRHDEVNGRRFRAPVDVEFTDVPIRRGAEPVDPPRHTP